MADDEIIKMEISGRSIASLEEFIKSIPYGAKGIAVTAFVKYIIGDSSHGLMHEPAYKYVSRAKAYGKVANDGAPAGYFSWAQFRFVMANIASGKFTPGTSQRTGKQSSSWGYRGDPSTRVTIYNSAPGSAYTMGNKTQANQPNLVGWRMVKEVVASNFKGGIRAAQQAVNKWLKDKNKA